MNDGPNGSTVSDAPSIATQTPVPAPSATPPQPLWAIPAETAELLRNLNTQTDALLQRVGAIEVDYLAAKQTALEELKNKRVLFKSILDEAARKAGLDLEKSRWNLDPRNMTLIRVS